MTRPLKILFVSPFYPYPEDKDGVRKILANLLSETVHEIEIVSLADDEDLAFHHARQEENEKLRFTLYPYKQTALSKMGKKLRWLFSRYPWLIVKYAKSLKAIQNYLINYGKHFDIIHLWTPALAHTMRTLPASILKKVVFSPIDSFSLFYQRRLSLMNSWKVLPLSYEYFKIKKMEKSYYPLARRTLFVSSTDAHHFKKMVSHASVAVIPNGISDQFLVSKKTVKDPKSLLFLGHLDYPPNRDAVFYLCQKLMPYLYKKDPSIHLKIVGKNHEKFFQFFKVPNITFEGFVDDIYACYQQASFFICPLRFGSGIKNKVLEAMGSGLCVIGSPCSFEGIGGKHSETYIQVDSFSPEVWGKTIEKLMLNKDRQRSISENAHSWIAKHHIWLGIRKRYDQVYEECLA